MSHEASLPWRPLAAYLSQRYGQKVEVDALEPLGGVEEDPRGLKRFGYGRPFLVTYAVNGTVYREVVHSVQHNQFGRERDDDCVAATWLDYTTFNDLPRHVQLTDILVREADGALRSIAGAQSLHAITIYAPGTLYADDLLRLRDGGDLRPRDIDRAAMLGRYLAAIHQTRFSDDALRGRVWRRRLRDLLGHGEGIMGLTDSYDPEDPIGTPALLRRIETAANRWRWRLKKMPERLVQVHGDFHPFNILFDEAGELSVLDRSRGAWGAAEDDVSCLAVNYIFFSLQRSGTFCDPFARLHETFWSSYFAERADDALTRTVQPWFAWRILVLASPLWYPSIAPEIRRQLFTFACRVLDARQFDFRAVRDYLVDPRTEPVYG